MTDRKVKVGVTLRVNGAKGVQSLWENGIFQNCFFLVELLNQAPHVEKAFLVLCGTGDKASREHFANLYQGDVPFIHDHEAAETLDVLIEMSTNLPENYLPRFLERGGKIVAMKVGNDYVIDTERVVFGLDPASLVRANVPHTAVWTIPEYQSTGVQYHAILNRAPCRVVPHIWSPKIFAQALAKFPELSYGHQPGRRPSVAVFEPNVCMVKTSFIPILALEEAHTQDPNLLERVVLFNTMQFAKDNKMFIETVNNLKLQQHGIAFYEPRIAAFEAMAKYANAVVCHQIENAQNYLYYEILWGGYPLIHNSKMLGDCGYYYPDFDTEQAGRVIVRALREHDENRIEYNVKAVNFVSTLDPLHPDNIQAYDDALVEVINS